MRHKHSLSSGQIQLLDTLLDEKIEANSDLAQKAAMDLVELQSLGFADQRSFTIGSDWHHQWGITHYGVAFLYAYHTVSGK